MIMIKINDKSYRLDGAQYSNLRRAMFITDPITAEPYATCTVNLPELRCASNEVFVKDYSENEGMAQILIDNGIIEPGPLSTFKYNFVEISKYKLTRTAIFKLWQKINIHS